MNVRRLRKLAKFIQQRPSKYDQGRYCGSACCLAGHAAILAGVDEAEVLRKRAFRCDDDLPNGTCVVDVASEWLGIDEAEADRLFADHDASDHEDGWPVDLYARLKKAKAVKTRAKIAAERIERFIKTGGAE